MPAESVLGGEPVGPAVAGQHVRVAAREAGHVGAVGAGPVAHAVEVHGVGPAVQGVAVAEVHEDAVPHAGADQRARDEVLVARAGGRIAQRSPPARGVAPVDDRGEDGLGRPEGLAHDRVAPVGDDVPGHRHGGHPVLAHRGGRGRGEGQRRRPDRQRGQGGGRAPHRMVSVLSGPCRGPKVMGPDDGKGVNAARRPYLEARRAARRRGRGLAEAFLSEASSPAASGS